jgi:hypothetical protein
VDSHAGRRRVSTESRRRVESLAQVPGGSMKGKGHRRKESAEFTEASIGSLFRQTTALITRQNFSFRHCSPAYHLPGLRHRTPTLHRRAPPNPRPHNNHNVASRQLPQRSVLKEQNTAHLCRIPPVKLKSRPQSNPSSRLANPLSCTSYLFWKNLVSGIPST